MSIFDYIDERLTALARPVQKRWSPAAVAFNPCDSHPLSALLGGLDRDRSGVAPSAVVAPRLLPCRPAHHEIGIPPRHSVQRNSRGQSGTGMPGAYSITSSAR